MAGAGKLSVVITIVLIIVTTSNTLVSADPDMLQDLCVADLKSHVITNGFVCTPNFTAEDFFFAGLASPGNTNNSMGSKVTAANVLQIPGLNTLGISMARIDYDPNGGLNQPHTHPRATEIVYVLYGELDVGFITTADVLVSKVIKQGDIFIFPKGLIHFQQNNGRSPAAVISSFNSQFPGLQAIAPSLFAAKPPVQDNVLTRAFQIDTQQVDQIKSTLAPPKS